MGINFGFDQSWWTVMGLSLDIIGVVLVAKNWRKLQILLRREWKSKELIVVQNRALRMIRTFYEMPQSEVEKLKEISRSHSDPKNRKNAGTQLLAHEVMRAALPFIIRLAERGFKNNGGPDELWVKLEREFKSDSPNKQHVDEIVTEANAVCRRKLLEEAEQANWDQSNFGLALVVVGFALQMVGSWPQ